MDAKEESLFRCRGHCCKRFALEHSYAELQADLARWKADPASSKIREVALIAPMVIPIASHEKASEYVYRCKNLSDAGDCTIYETRPQMCREFPMPQGCHFWSCKSDQSAYLGQSLPRKIWNRYRWLRSLK